MVILIKVDTGEGGGSLNVDFKKSLVSILLISADVAKGGGVE